MLEYKNSQKYQVIRPPGELLYSLGLLTFDCALVKLKMDSSRLRRKDTTQGQPLRILSLGKLNDLVCHMIADKSARRWRCSRLFDDDHSP